MVVSASMFEEPKGRRHRVCSWLGDSLGVKSETVELVEGRSNRARQQNLPRHHSPVRLGASIPRRRGQKRAGQGELAYAAGRLLLSPS